MKKLLSLVLALIIAAALPLAVFAAVPEIEIVPADGGTVNYEIKNETDTGFTLRVTSVPDEGWELEDVMLTGGLGAFAELIDPSDSSLPDWVEFNVSGEYPSLTIIPFFKQTSAPASMKGDLDGDKEITVSDALRALRIAAKLVQPTEEDIATGDVDYDGEITVSDALKILRVAAKLASQESLESAR